MGGLAGPPSPPAGPAALELASAASRLLVDRLGARPDAVVVLGTGLGPAADGLGAGAEAVDLTTLPGFVAPGAPGHRSTGRLATVGSRNVLVLEGRVHLYEGRTAAEVAHGVRTAVLAGARTVVLTNAAGALAPGLAPGDVVAIADHLDLTGTSGPLAGLVGSEPHPFVEMSGAWSAELRRAARAVRPSLPEGVYAQLRGPQFETPAEIRMLRTLGADLVGMSTVVEAVAARHLGAQLLGLSVVTNLAAGVEDRPVPVGEITATATAAAPEVARLVGAALAAGAAGAPDATKAPG